MATVEQTGFLKYKDSTGNTYLVLPITTKDNVDGIDEIEAAIEALQALVGTKSVSDQISDATDNCITEMSISGTTITYKKGDGTSGSLTTQDTDTVYTHPTTSGYKHIPAGGSYGQIIACTSPLGDSPNWVTPYIYATDDGAGNVTLGLKTDGSNILGM